jgi:hypothetical protein
MVILYSRSPDVFLGPSPNSAKLEKTYAYGSEHGPTLLLERAERATARRIRASYLLRLFYFITDPRVRSRADLYLAGSRLRP